MKTWITVPVSELPNVDWSQTRNTSENTVPRNVAGDTALVKFTGDMPSSISSISGKGAELDHAGAIALLATEAWTDSEVI
jgi:hypothetical protein